MLTYTPSFIPQRILVVGCGGTGSRLIPQIAQFIKTVGWVINPELVIVDDDIVEEKNLRRQNFVSLDINKPKAVVLAQRYSKAYDINIIPIVTRVSRTSETSAIFSEKMREWSNNSSPMLLVMCVDSAEARRDILSIVGNVGDPQTILVIDTGNENNFGQVNVSTLSAADSDMGYLKVLPTIPKNMPGEFKLPILPLDISYYKDMVSSPAPSCADLDQTMAINSLVATTAFGVIQNWYYARPISFFKINVTLEHGSVPEYITEAHLLKLLKRTKDIERGEIITFLPRGVSTYSLNSTLLHIKNAAKAYKEKMEAYEREEKVKAEKAKIEANRVEAVNILQTITNSLETYLGVTLKEPSTKLSTPVLTEEEKAAVEAIKKSLEEKLTKRIQGAEIFTVKDIDLSDITGARIEYTPPVAV